MPRFVSFEPFDALTGGVWKREYEPDGTPRRVHINPDQVVAVLGDWGDPAKTVLICAGGTGRLRVRVSEDVDSVLEALAD